MKLIKILSLFLLTVNTCYAVQGKYNHVLSQLQLPEGFSISIYADNLPNARTLALSDSGVVYVGTRKQGSVYAVKDTNGDGFADKRYVIATNLYMPNGVAFNDGNLYVAETNKIIRFTHIEHHLDSPPNPVVIFDKLPSDQHHGWKYLRIGKDNRLYTAVGAPCNICLPEKDIYSSLVRLNLDGSGFNIIARGIRNSVGFDWHPITKQLFFTDNGRDHMGDDIPPDELNKWTEKGQHFGYPFCHAGDIPDPELSGNNKCQKFIAPEWKFKAHMAPLGLRFYTGQQFPKEYKNQLFVAQHGSWNRSEPHGYRIALVKFEKGKPVSEQVFISGWLTKDEKVLGRPTDILQMPDGSLLIADDTLGVIYRVVYGAGKK
jgi:glucose/arabinose dehydrogenase